MNMEQQSQGVTYQPEFDFTTQAEWARPLGGGEGAIPTAAPKREQQVFAAWKEELNWDERLLEAIADPGNLRRAYRKVKSNGGAAGVDGMNIDDVAEWLRAHPGELRQSLLQGSYQPQDVRGKSIPKPNGGEQDTSGKREHRKADLSPRCWPMCCWMILTRNWKDVGKSFADTQTTASSW